MPESSIENGKDLEMLHLAQDAAKEAGIENPVILSRKEYEKMLEDQSRSNRTG